MRLNLFESPDFLFTSKTFEMFSFIIANLIICAIFFLFLGHAPEIICLYILSFFVTILFLKNQWLLSHLAKKDQSESEGFESEPTKSVDFSIKKMGIVVSKQLYYNISYELFPTLIVWIGVLGLAYLLINVTSTFVFGSSILIFNPKQEFYEIITILGILLGVYQFYLSRQEQKNLIKINQYAHKIQEIIQNETTFEKYFNYISSKCDSGFVSWIEENTNPKLNSFSLLRAIRKDPEIFEAFKELLFPQNRKRTVESRNRPLVNFQIMYRDSNQKFETIEYLAKLEKREGKLKKSYSSFFFDKKRIDELVDNIKSEIDFNEFGVLTMSNINIVTEVIPDFIDKSFKKQMMDFIKEIDEQDLSKIECITAREYRTMLESIVFKKLFRNIFGDN